MSSANSFSLGYEDKDGDLVCIFLVSLSLLLSRFFGDFSAWLLRIE